MSTEYTPRAALMERCEKTFREFGGRARATDLKAHLEVVLTDDEWAVWGREQLGPLVNAYFRQRDASGLPHAPMVNDSGEHVQLELLSLDEFRYAIGKYMSRSSANRDVAYRLAGTCREQYGVWLNPDEIDLSA